MLKLLLLCHHKTWCFIVHTQTNSVSGCSTLQNEFFFLQSGIIQNFQMCISLVFFCLQIRPCIALQDISFPLSPVSCVSESLPGGSLLSFIESSMPFHSVIQFLATQGLYRVFHDFRA